MAVLFRREPAKKQGVFIRCQSPLENFCRRTFLPKACPVGYVDSFGIITLPVVLTQRFGNHYGRVGQPNRSAFAQLQNPRRQSAPFLSLPVESLNSHDCFLSRQPRQERKQRRPEG